MNGGWRRSATTQPLPVAQPTRAVEEDDELPSEVRAGLYPHKPSKRSGCCDACECDGTLYEIGSGGAGGEFWACTSCLPDIAKNDTNEGVLDVVVDACRDAGLLRRSTAKVEYLVQVSAEYEIEAILDGSPLGFEPDLSLEGMSVVAPEQPLLMKQPEVTSFRVLRASRIR